MSRSVYIFFLISCLISWTIWILMIMSNKGVISFDIPRAVHFATPIGPLIGSIVACRYTYVIDLKNLFKNLLKFKVSYKWYLLSILIPLAAYALSAGLTFLLRPNPEYQFNLVLNAFAILITLPFIVFGEEIGWRGFALTVLQKRIHPIKSALIIGVMWSVWHLPAFFVAELFDSAGQFVLVFIGFTILCCILSILFSWIVNSSGGSIMMAVLMHSAIGASSSLTNVAIKDPVNFFSLFAFMFLVIAVLIINRYGGKLGIGKIVAKRIG